MKKIIIAILISFILLGCDNASKTRNKSNSNDNSNIVSNETSNMDSNEQSNSNVDYDKSKVGKNNVTLYLFYLSTCPHCHDEITWLESIENKYPYLTIKKYEVTENYEMYEKVVEKMNINDYHVPLTIISNEHKIGFSSSNSDSLINIIEEKSTYDNCDVVNLIINDEKYEQCLKK